MYIEALGSWSYHCLNSKNFLFDNCSIQLGSVSAACQKRVKLETDDSDI